jgi:uncharacterized OB-fold protein
MDLAKHWRVRDARYRLEGQRHRETGEVSFPPDPDQGEEWEPFVLSGRGSVYSFTVMRQAPDGYDEHSPYMLALVKLAEGPVVTAQLTDCEPDQIAIDQPVEMVTRKLRDLGQDGLIVFGYKFRPLLVG